MGERVATVEQAAAAFRTLADAEGTDVPMYAHLCRSIAADARLASMLLEAPVGQRLPVLVLAALHDLVLDDPEVPLGRWYPSVGGDPAHGGDLDRALQQTVAGHRDRLTDRVRHRQVQTNEVNRCIAWRLGMAVAGVGADRPVALVEVGASAGLNLGLASYRIDLDGAGPGASLGPRSSPVRLAAHVRRGSWPELVRPAPRVVARTGLDRRPARATDPDDARWLEACTWPEQTARLARLRAALAATAADPPRLVRGDLVDDVADLVADAPPGADVVVLSSWTLAYVDRARRSEFLAEVARAARLRATAGTSVRLLTLEADHVLPWMDPPPLPDGSPAELRHSSLLALTSFDRSGEPAPEPLARCQAHLRWIERIQG